MHHPTIVHGVIARFYGQLHGTTTRRLKGLLTPSKDQSFLYVPLPSSRAPRPLSTPMKPQVINLDEKLCKQVHDFLQEVEGNEMLK